MDITVLYKPSSFIGGDFYDFLPIDAQHLGVLICDVKGHGVASAMITATIKFQLHDLEGYYREPAALLTQLNKRLEQFFSSTANDYFVTAFYGVLDMEKYEQYRSNLPADTVEVVIDGGCHAGFGRYGAQDGDGTPTISSNEQIARTAEEIAQIAG